MSKQKRPPPNGPVQAGAITIDGRDYEARFVDCGKDNCTRCNKPGGRVPTHGPYWYLCAQRFGKFRRVYIGKTLDPLKYITKEGAIDWNRILHRARRRDPVEKHDHDAPGQTDLLKPDPILPGAPAIAPGDPNDPGPIPDWVPGIKYPPQEDPDHEK